MTPITRIREFVRATLMQMAVGESADMRETLLIREGKYCGHRFAMAKFNAVWFIEEDEIKFYVPDGSLAQTLKPSDISVPVESQHAVRAA